ncbi:Uncharacterized conserved protein, contains NRDE domain [Sphingomonas laterariae]|uniref:Uncharacterized conserved protein, contains NRDE domain n=1 Tax=Edaphosphingomonas laterariae TaxID=861865 RepID=A0A239G4M8_9SPHN|nr:NRDE family protein [Sphingomonas laterariae]SNS63602.1 Uncharacterized conserved protein, contains NRDE domain [Sphingomonas laterariae]
MCVLAFAWQAHPRWRLIAAGNRDELHARPAAALHHWPAPSPLIAGQDLASGGTWMGVSDQGRFAVVTNLRGYGGPEPDRASRGALVCDMLAGNGHYAAPSDADLADFNPFNLIVADRERADFLSNRPGAIRSPLTSGIYGLSNGRLDEPWPKTIRLKAILLDWIVNDATDPAALLSGLAEATLPAAGLQPASPSDVPEEALLSPIFIRNAVYGTRCSTVVAIDMEGQGRIIERRFAADGSATGETALSFRWPG